MPFDFSKIEKTKVKSTDPKWSNPVSFFYKLFHPEIKDLFPVQRDILKEWYSEFEKGENDKMVSLNTGRGKTLIGLMIAESIRRKTFGKVVYMCPNNFLGQQTIDEASKYGIDVSSYLNLDGQGPRWINETAFLQNESICLTTYHAMVNSRSKFKKMEIKGIIFDDAHLSLEIFDQQFSVRSSDKKLIKNISDIFKTSPFIKESIKNIQEGDPTALIMIPAMEWHNQSETIKDILNKNEKIINSLPWINIKDNLSKTFCFISGNRIEIGFIYPDAKNNYIFDSQVQRVYLSATLPNLDDLTRVFGITPTRIEIEDPDYRPERLFIFSKRVNFENSDDVIRENLANIAKKSLVLTSNKNDLAQYKVIKALIPDDSADVVNKIKDFKKIDSGILALANRYDGIDIPGNTCHSLVIDGLPYTGSLKTRFFSEYFHNHKNSLLRSVIASKLVQAFGRTIRSSNGYSVIFLLGDKLNSWLINKDNKNFFKKDLYEDIELGIGISKSIDSFDDLKDLVNAILNQNSDWKSYLEAQKIQHIKIKKEGRDEEGIVLAKEERKIYDYYLKGNYRKCLELIVNAQQMISSYSKPVLGLYLSMATVCCHETNDKRIKEFSDQAYGINPIFGMPTSDSKRRSQQAQRIIDFSKNKLHLDWKITGKMFDENIKILGEAIGFSAYRPETYGDGTLDACWVDEEKKIVLGFENKIDKTNKVLSKKEIDQCAGHLNWLEKIYPKYQKTMFVVGEFESYNGLASPGDLYFLRKGEFKKISDKLTTVHAKRTLPEQIDPSLDDLNLRISKLFPKNLIADLPQA